MKKNRSLKARLQINKACGSGFIKISNVAKRNLRHARISHAFMYVEPGPEQRDACGDFVCDSISLPFRFVRAQRDLTIYIYGFLYLMKKLVTCAHERNAAHNMYVSQMHVVVCKGSLRMICTNNVRANPSFHILIEIMIIQRKFHCQSLS